MRNEGTDRAGWASAPAGHLTPADVQQKQFRTARMGGGYRMREVDEFLDQITDTLTSLIAENDRLRRAPAGGGAAPSTSSAPVHAGDRAAIEAFLRREKAFLQNLGSLVQGHAEELKGMVRSSRETVAPEAPAAVAAAAAVPEEPRHVDAAVAAAEEAPVDVAEPEETEQEPAIEVADHDEADPDSDTGTIAAAEAEEPIRLDEPEPARSRRTEHGTDGSLRELFWGEE